MPAKPTNERENKPHHRALADTKDEILVQAAGTPIGAEAIGKLRNIAHRCRKRLHFLIGEMMALAESTLGLLPTSKVVIRIQPQA